MYHATADYGNIYCVVARRNTHVNWITKNANFSSVSQNFNQVKNMEEILLEILGD